jgi:DNA-binding response OmpR family regulator
VVGDNRVIVNTLAFNLKTKGYNVCAALDGADAVSSVRKESPDLILWNYPSPAPMWRTAAVCFGTAF